VAETTEQQTHKVTDDGIVLVPLKLAHPMAKHYAERARAETVRDYQVNETIWVDRDNGNALVDGGFVQVDPVDVRARQRALFLNRRNAALTVKEIEALLAKEVREAREAEQAETEAEKAEGDGDADAAVGARAEGHQSAADAPSSETPGRSKGTRRTTGQ
jgi:hypothetical protein